MPGVGDAQGLTVRGEPAQMVGSSPWDVEALAGGGELLALECSRNSLGKGGVRSSVALRSVSGPPRRSGGDRKGL